MTDDLAFAPATELAARIRSGQLSPVEAVDACLDRIDDRDDAVNAYVTVLRERAREAAREAERAVERGDDLGPLHGVPVAVKDLTPLSGVRLTFGCEPLADNVADRTAFAVERLLDAGAIVLGKTNTPEFGLKVKTDNLLVGPTSTPFALDRNAGGSSGGSAAAVADGQAALAEGSDAGGSVRIPSALCGVVGFKPSFGRIPLTDRPDAFAGHTPFVHHGSHGRTVADAALLADVMAGPHPRDPFSLPDDGVDFRGAVDRPVEDLSVAYSPDLGTWPLDPRVRSTVDDAVEALADAGAEVTAVDVDLGHSLDDLIETSMVQWESKVAVLAERLAGAFDVDVTGEDRDRLPDAMVEMAEAGGEHSAVAFKRADVGRTEVYDGIQDVFDDHDLLVSATTAVPPFSNDVLGPEVVDGTEVDPLSGWFLTMPFNMTGHPAVSVPAGFPEGLPVGMQLVGRRFADEDALAAAGAVERERPWDAAYPPGS